MADGIGGVFDSTQHKAELVDYLVGGGHVRLCEIAVEEFDCVREEEMIGDGI